MPFVSLCRKRKKSSGTAAAFRVSYVGQLSVDTHQDLRRGVADLNRNHSALSASDTLYRATIRNRCNAGIFTAPRHRTADTFHRQIDRLATSNSQIKLAIRILAQRTIDRLDCCICQCSARIRICVRVSVGICVCIRIRVGVGFIRIGVRLFLHGDAKTVCVWFFVSVWMVPGTFA